MVAVVSPQYLRKEWTKYEEDICTALNPSNKKRKLIPLLHTKCKLPPRISRLSYGDFSQTLPNNARYKYRLAQLLSDLNPKKFKRPQDEESFSAGRRIAVKRTRRGKVAARHAPKPGRLLAGSRMPHGRNAQFVGREDELRKLAKALTPGAMTTVGVHAAVSGMGGVGKTQLAIEYVHRYGRLYPGGVFWLNMENPETAMNEVALCGGAEGMGLPDFDKMSLPDQAAAVQRGWRDGKACLIIFDNAEREDVVERWRPKTGRCALIITSRRDSWPGRLGVLPIPVETLPRDKSLELLATGRPSIATRIEERKSADGICQQLGDLPIALAVAAEFLRTHPSESLQEYAEALAAQGEAPEESLAPVWACFSVSYEKLQAGSATDTLAMQLFHLASHFAPVSINPMLLAVAAGLDGEQKKDRRTFDEAVGRLRGLGLVSVEPDGRLLLHRLLRQFAARCVPPGTTADESLQRVASVLLRLASALEEKQVSHLLAGEVQHVQEAAKALFDREEEPGGQLFNLLGVHFRAMAAFSVAREYLEQTRDFAQRVYGENHANFAAALSNLGGVLQDMGDLPAARAHYERALKIDEATYGPDHPRVATDVNNLGSVLLALGDREGARRCASRALEIARKVYGEEHPTTVACWRNLEACK